MISYAVIFVYIAVALGEHSSWKRLLVRLRRMGSIRYSQVLQLANQQLIPLVPLVFERVFINPATLCLFTCVVLGEMS